ncbi:protease modulator HflK N-terminal domain-containing protein [Bordetella parapertussis]|uniref:protease modulator HflK N-terminal domain-containing protein n=1 Tax=Bordetella parapertussis TaxID=519 RepID=UPI000C9E27FE|nr:protease modulator HflK N-terminal domain-containing protein [Bordetella parapertussis]PNM47832.1 hypothetical protein AL462_000010 [Bordetella parapertussis]
MSRITKLFNLNDPGWAVATITATAPSRRDVHRAAATVPDLDEVWRDFNNRIGALFGRKGGGATIAPTTAAA